MGGHTTAAATTASIVGTLSLLQAVKREMRYAKEYAKRQGFIARNLNISDSLKTFKTLLVVHRDSVKMLCQGPNQGDDPTIVLDFQKLEALIPRLVYTLLRLWMTLDAAIDSWSSSGKVSSRQWTYLERAVAALRQLQAVSTVAFDRCPITGGAFLQTCSAELNVADVAWNSAIESGTPNLFAIADLIDPWKSMNERALTILHLACLDTPTISFGKLLEAGTGRVDRGNGYGYARLLWTAGHGGTSNLVTLLRHGGDLESRVPMALRLRSSRQLRFTTYLAVLQEAIANPKVIDMDGYSALYADITRRRIREIAESLLGVPFGGGKTSQQTYSSTQGAQNLDSSTHECDRIWELPEDDDKRIHSYPPKVLRLLWEKEVSHKTDGTQPKIVSSTQQLESDTLKPEHQKGPHSAETPCNLPASGPKNDVSRRTRQLFKILVKIPVKFVLLLDSIWPVSSVVRARQFAFRMSLAALFRPCVARNHIRITWSCHCGTDLYADYPDTDPEMIARFSEELNEPTVASLTATNLKGGQQIALTAPPFAHPSRDSGSLNYCSSLGEANSSGVASSRAASSYACKNTIPSQLLTPRFFELCVNTGSLCQSLREIDVTRISNDVEFFRWVRKSYQDLRGWRRHWRFCLRPKSMRFVYFGVEQGRKVHILSQDESYPPQDEIAAQRYIYTPCPTIPTGSLPMPSNAFIHYLQYCNLDVEVPPAQRIWLDRLPKKLKEPLMEASKNPDPNKFVEAWGVHIDEGLDATMALWTTIIALALGLEPLLGVYIHHTGDVQSATGIASVVLGIMAMLWMCMQVEIGRNT